MFQKGAWIAEYGAAGYRSAEASRQLRRLRALGARWIAWAPHANMPDIDRPAIEYGIEGGECAETIRFIRGHGLHVFLFPRIESPAFFRPPYPFRADIAMTTPGDWETFHRNLEAMAVHYARIAEAEGARMYSLGLEYRASTSRFPDRWRAIAGAVRSVYSGGLTYSANWWREWEEVAFWDALDYIGIGAYFEVAGRPRPDRGEIAAGWRPVLSRIGTFSTILGRPVLFTETGYPPYADCAERPWEWTRREGKILDPDAQREAWDMLIETVWDRPWFAGLYPWRWYTDASSLPPEDYCPEGRPAEAVIESAYRRPAPRFAE